MVKPRLRRYRCLSIVELLADLPGGELHVVQEWPLSHLCAPNMGVDE